MTEYEMKMKWCPVARVETRGPAGLTTCIGSACAWWRWFDKFGTDEAGKPNYYSGPWQGFCGAAGKP